MLIFTSLKQIIWDQNCFNEFHGKIVMDKQDHVTPSPKTNTASGSSPLTSLGSLYSCILFAEVPYSLHVSSIVESYITEHHDDSPLGLV